jgi:hypothetical protein
VRIIIIFIFSLSSTCLFAQLITVSGYIREHGSLESIPGVTVGVRGHSWGVVSNTYGFYSLQIPSNQSFTLYFSSVGYQSIERNINSAIDVDLPIELNQEIRQLDEIVVKTEPQAAEMSVIRLPIAQIKQIPTLLGEKDVIKALQLLPGVQKGTEGFTALYVRGGGPDQNLTLLDEAQVYNANHVFGLFSTFNGDAIKNVSFWKGGFPARYGGRLSSVIDLQMKEGNKEKFHGEGGIGLLSSRLTVEGPLVKNKSSFLIAGRRSYFDLISKPFMSASSKTGYTFYDINAKANWDFSSRDKIYISTYFGNDLLSVKDQSPFTATGSNIETKSTLRWGNATGTLRWNHQFTPKLFVNTTLLFTDFHFSLTEDYLRRRDSITTNTKTVFQSFLRDYSFKTDFDYFLSNTHVIKTGLQLTSHKFKPRAYSEKDLVLNSTNRSNQRYSNTEYAAYIEDSYKPSELLKVNAGLRISGLYSAGRNYLFLEPRLIVNYLLFNKWNLTASYARSNQFIHLLSNTGVGLSTDLWVPTTSKSPPQQSDQIAAGISFPLNKKGLLLSVETYRKWMRNILAYRDGASFLAVSDGVQDLKWEDNITTGRGWSYGTELLLQKNTGKLTGWIGYTLSWSINQFTELNNGKRFFPRYDRRHDLSVVGSYQLSDKIRLSANWVYATGNALTIPQSTSFVNYDRFADPTVKGDISNIDYLGSRNSFRAQAYHRLDFGIQFLKKKKWGERYWEFGLYNAYSRKNPFYYHLKRTMDYSLQGQRWVLVKKSLFPLIPSVSYNFKF